MAKATAKLDLQLAEKLLHEQFGKQSALARSAGISTATVCRVFAGDAVSELTCRAIERSLGVEIGSLREIHTTAAAAKLATKAPVNLRSAAPPYAPTMFGRDGDTVDLIYKVLDAKNSTNSGVVLVAGAPGVGKTSLLNHFVRNNTLASEFPDGCFWAAVGQQATVHHLLQRWGRTLRVSDANFVREDEAAASMRAAFDRKQVLLVVDDIWTESQAELFRIAGPNSVILFSTRIAKLVHQFALPPECVHYLSGLETQDGIKLLASIAPDVVGDHPKLCAQLIESVDGLPLAIHVAGRMLHRETQAGENVGLLLKQIRDDTKLLMEEFVPPDMSDLLSQTTPAVAAVLRRSTNVLSDSDRFYFARLAVVPPAPKTFSMKFTHKHLDVTHDEGKKFAKRLVAAGLLDTAGKGHYRIHPVIQALAKYELERFDAEQR